ALGIVIAASFPRNRPATAPTTHPPARPGKAPPNFSPLATPCGESFRPRRGSRQSDSRFHFGPPSFARRTPAKWSTFQGRRKIERVTVELFSLCYQNRMTPLLSGRVRIVHRS